MRVIKDHVMPALIGLAIAAATIYVLVHPSSCRWEEVC